MSLNKSATRRLSLLTGSSLVAASLTALGGLTIAPTAAIAQATCTSPAAPTGNGTTAVTIAAGTYDPGITCSYVGGGSTVTTAGAVTVSSAVGGNGINLTATGSSAINWNSAAGGVTGGANTNGAVIDATSASGAISITTLGVTANAAGTTYGIRATSGDALTSTPGGNITITRLANGAVNNNVAGGEAAIGAFTNGGNINIATVGNTTGRLRGIHARTNGAGSVTMTTAGTVNASAIDGLAAIDVVAGTGGVSITTSSNTVNAGTGTGFAIRVAATGAATINNTGSTIGSVSSGMANGGGAVDFSGVTGNVTFTHAGATNNTGRWLASGASVFGAGNDTVNMLGIGHNFLGGIDALAEASIDFGAGDDTFNVAAFLSMGAFTQNAGSIDFGSGSDTFNLSGVFTSHGGDLENLEALNLSGTLFLGAASTGGTAPMVNWTATDGVADDVLRVNGATFTGSGNARIVMDVNIGGGVQAGCETLTGIADCLDLRGGSTAGVTTLAINNLGPDALFGGYDLTGVTLVDVGGGTSAQGHFVLDPNTPDLTTHPLYGDVIRRPGLFSIMLRYDPETQRHVLVSLPHGEVMEYGMLSGAAQSVWHMTAETVTDRQAELRERPDATGLWLRASGEYSKREASSSFQGVAETYTIDNSYKLYAGTIMGGMDLISGSSGGFDYVLGAQIGYVSASFDLDERESSGRFTGATGGVYGGLWNDWFFLDGAVNLNGLTLDHSSPGLGAQTNTYVSSVGASAESGLRATLSERIFAEPLVTLSYVRTSFEEISLSGGEVQPADAESLRGALGLRLGGTLSGEGASATYFVTGRAWNEFEGETGGVVRNPGADLPFSDEFTGAFGEAEVGVSVFNSANTLSGYVTTGVKFKDGYSATNLSLGVRLAW